MKIAVCFASAIGAVAATGFPGLATAGDADVGKQLAERWCQSCHVIGSNQPMAVTEAPPFATIARKPDFDEAKIARFLLDPHPKMPDIGLSREAAADLAAFIASRK